MFKVITLSAMAMASLLLTETVWADDNAIAKAQYSITQQLKQAHDRYRQNKSDYNAGYLKGLEQAQIVLSMYAQSTNREEAKAALRQALQQREKQKQKQQKKQKKQKVPCASCAYTTSPMQAIALANKAK